MIRALPIALALTALALGARAQEAIPTAADAPAGGAPASPPPSSIDIPDKHVHDDRGPIAVNACGIVTESTDGAPAKPDKNPHGEVWAGVGTHGYREVGGAACMPIGKHAAVTIAVDQTQWSGGRRR